MQSVQALLFARWIIPAQPAGLVHENHALVIDNGRIVAIVAREEALQRFEPKLTHDLGNHALIPGLINTHTHASMTLLRGYADDLSLMTWLEQYIWPVETRWVDEEFVRDGVELAIAEMLRGGTTCFNDMYFFPDVAATTAEQIGIRMCTGLIILDFPTAWASSADEYFEKATAVHDQFRNNELITTAFAPHAPYSVSDESLTRVAVLADETNIPIHMHVHETRDEVRNAVAEKGERPLSRLSRLGLVSPRLLAVHMTQLENDEIDQLAVAGSHIVHCPESNLKLASGFCPIHKLITSDINVALGTDGAASNNDLDMFSEMRTAALLAKAVADDATALPAAQALKMATINGARALGIDKVTGSLEIGKAADIIAVDLSDIENQPLYDPVSQLVYAGGRDRVTDVWVGGQHLLQDRTLQTMDRSSVLDKASRWQQRIAETSL